MVPLESLAIPLGSKASDFSLPSVDGQTYSLKSFEEAAVLLIVFTCNHCPYARAAWPYLIKLQDEFRDRGVQFIAINPNDEKQYPEDSFQEMKVRAREWGVNFPYLRDESQEVARAYQAQCTPDIYVYDEKRTLRYHGRLVENWHAFSKGGGGMGREELREAIEALLAGKEPDAEQYPSLGCSIKWKAAS